ncbi:MAG: hypothetical protein ABI468_05725 [Candidatus Nanopelagicales bacterium]
MPVELPDAAHRWRCAQCGNLTRFDVTSMRRVKEYWHLDLSGDLVVPEVVSQTEVLSESIEKVACRWCGAEDAVQKVPRPAGGDPSTGPDADPPA